MSAMLCILHIYFIQIILSHKNMRICEKNVNFIETIDMHFKSMVQLPYSFLNTQLYRFSVRDRHMDSSDFCIYDRYGGIEYV